MAVCLITHKHRNHAASPGKISFLVQLPLLYHLPVLISSLTPGVIKLSPVKIDACRLDAAT